MPRYFFHVEDGRSFPDTVGTVLADDGAARAEAIGASSEAINNLGDSFWNGSEWQMRVVDETERSVLTLHFRGEIREP